DQLREPQTPEFASPSPPNPAPSIRHPSLFATIAARPSSAPPSANTAPETDVATGCPALLPLPVRDKSPLRNSSSHQSAARPSRSYSRNPRAAPAPAPASSLLSSREPLVRANRRSVVKPAAAMPDDLPLVGATH